MKLLVDQQLPPALARWLADRGEDAVHVRDVGLRDASDQDVRDYAIAEGRVILTKDEDFQSRRNRSDAGPKIVWLRLGNATNAILLGWLSPRWNAIAVRLKEDTPVIEVR